ncbi:Polysaccharide export protein [Beggiatoa sp. PS]|nr:Polysaccharide export protein [Beggiatoa sp. PS]
MLCSFISSCTSLTIFDEEDLFFEHKPSNEEPLKNANPDQQAKQQSEIQHKTKVQPEKLRRIEKPQPEKIKPVEKHLSEKPKSVEKPLSEKPKLVEKPQSEKPKRVEKRQPKKIRTVKRPQPRKQQPKPQIYEEDLNPTDILSSYRLGAGDKISIKVFGEPDFSVTTHLSETGTISYPFFR